MNPIKDQIPFNFPTEPPSLDDLSNDEPVRTAIAMLKRSDAWPGGSLAVVGPPKSGVTTLLQSWVKHADGQFLTPDQFNELDITDLDKLAHKPLALDDADAPEISGAHLLSLMNLFVERSVSLVLGGHRDPRGWQESPPDLLSRLTAMTRTNIERLTEESLRDRLEAVGRERYLKLPAETLDFLAPRMDREFAMVDRICALLVERGIATGRPPTVPLAREVLEIIENDGHEELDASLDSGEA